MSYCPHCSEAISESSKICPHCKKTVELQLLSSVYEPGQKSTINTRARRRLWFKENATVILPIIAVLIGFAAGAISMFFYDQILFASTRTDYENRISELEATINQQKSQATNSASAFEGRLEAKDQVITILAEELDILGRVLNFTNRLARNSVITVNTPEEEDYYKRNIVYLNTLFSQQEEQLQETEFQQERAFNLLVIPQLFGE
jgi:hypothetical protein